jgi:hypothetical protein
MLDALVVIYQRSDSPLVRILLIQALTQSIVESSLNYVNCDFTVLLRGTQPKLADFDAITFWLCSMRLRP